MAMADAIRQSTLPSIGYLDLDKIKRDYSQSLPVSAALNIPVPPLASPTNMYSGPPPPYSYQSTAANSVAGLNAYISPPESRRTSGDEKEPPPPHHQSLPSIHEALGTEQHLSITSLLSKAGPPTISNPTPQQSSATAAPRSHPEVPSIAAPNPSSHAHSPIHPSHDPFEKPRPQYSTYLQIDSGSARFSAINNQESNYMATEPSRTGPSPVNAFRQPMQSWPRHQSPMHEQLPRPSTHTNSQYGYTPYQSTHSSYAPQTPRLASFEHAPVPHPSWRCAGSEIDRAEEMRRATVKQSPVPQAFGETVKRHLETFELETSLNEIAEGSGRALEFSRLYGSRAHQTQRSGPVPGSVPTIAECDDMIRQQEKVLTSVARIREVIITQQAALAEQRNYEYTHKPGSEVDEDGSMYQDKPDGSGGFAGSDTKKRRGRAAPPGRCHSCNRAETPEWRRGPDGARTLCNACGLHYAKLTRKMGSKASSTSSNLRPKDMDLSSPH